MDVDSHIGYIFVILGAMCVIKKNFSTLVQGLCKLREGLKNKLKFISAQLSWDWTGTRTGTGTGTGTGAGIGTGAELRNMNVINFC